MRAVGRTAASRLRKRQHRRFNYPSLRYFLDLTQSTDCGLIKFWKPLPKQGEYKTVCYAKKIYNTVCCDTSSSAEHMPYVDMFTVSKVHHQTSARKHAISYEMLSLSTWIVSAKLCTYVYMCLLVQMLTVNAHFYTEQIVHIENCRKNRENYH